MHGCRLPELGGVMSTAVTRLETVVIKCNCRKASIFITWHGSYEGLTGSNMSIGLPKHPGSASALWHLVKQCNGTAELLEWSSAIRMLLLPQTPQHLCWSAHHQQQYTTTTSKGCSAPGWSGMPLLQPSSWDARTPRSLQQALLPCSSIPSVSMPACHSRSLSRSAGAKGLPTQGASSTQPRSAQHQIDSDSNPGEPTVRGGLPGNQGPPSDDQVESSSQRRPKVILWRQIAKERSQSGQLQTSQQQQISPNKSSQAVPAQAAHQQQTRPPATHQHTTKRTAQLRKQAVADQPRGERPASQPPSNRLDVQPSRTSKQPQDDQLQVKGLSAATAQASATSRSQSEPIRSRSSNRAQQQPSSQQQTTRKSPASRQQVPDTQKVASKQQSAQQQPIQQQAIQRQAMSSHQQGRGVGVSHRGAPRAPNPVQPGFMAGGQAAGVVQGSSRAQPWTALAPTPTPLFGPAQLAEPNLTTPIQQPALFAGRQPATSLPPDSPAALLKVWRLYADTFGFKHSWLCASIARHMTAEVVSGMTTQQVVALTRVAMATEMMSPLLASNLMSWLEGHMSVLSSRSAEAAYIIWAVSHLPINLRVRGNVLVRWSRQALIWLESPPQYPIPRSELPSQDALSPIARTNSHSAGQLAVSTNTTSSSSVQHTPSPTVWPPSEQQRLVHTVGAAALLLHAHHQGLHRLDQELLQLLREVLTTAHKTVELQESRLSGDHISKMMQYLELGQLPAGWERVAGVVGHHEG